MSHIIVSGQRHDTAWDIDMDGHGVVQVKGITACPECGDTPVQWSHDWNGWTDETTISCRECNATYTQYKHRPMERD